MQTEAACVCVCAVRSPAEWLPFQRRLFADVEDPEIAEQSLAEMKASLAAGERAAASLRLF